MKRDATYIKKLLDAFEGCEESFPTVTDLRKHDPSIKEDRTLAYHLLQMQDAGLVIGANGEDVGVQAFGDGDVLINVYPLRLTSSGHDFAASLREPKVFEKVVGVIKDSGLSVAVQVAGTLATQFAMQKLGLPGP